MVRVKIKVKASTEIVVKDIGRVIAVGFIYFASSVQSCISQVPLQASMTLLTTKRRMTRLR